MTDPSSNNPLWQMVLSAAIALGLALLAAFWALADPRQEIKDIKTNYLTLREHEEFVKRFTADIGRIEQTNRDQALQLATKVEVTEHSRTDETARHQIDL